MTAQIKARDAGGTLRTLTRIRVRDEASNLRTILRVRMRDASNVLRTVFESVGSSTSGTSLSGSGATPYIATSAAATITPSGGTAPYVYEWIEVFNNNSIFAVTPNAATTYFARNACVSGELYNAQFFCRVTDGYGGVTDGDPVDIDLTRV
jgi:hypothetical protein